MERASIIPGTGLSHHDHVSSLLRGLLDYDGGGFLPYHLVDELVRNRHLFCGLDLQALIQSSTVSRKLGRCRLRHRKPTRLPMIQRILLLGVILQFELSCSAIVFPRMPASGTFLKVRLC